MTKLLHPDWLGKVQLIKTSSRYSEFHAVRLVSSIYLICGVVTGMRGRQNDSSHFSFERQTFQMQNFLWWRHFETNSDRLLRMFFSSAFMIASFSSKYRLHRLAPPEYTAAGFTINQLIVKDLLFSFRSQTSHLRKSFNDRKNTKNKHNFVFEKLSLVEFLAATRYPLTNR